MCGNTVLMCVCVSNAMCVMQWYIPQYCPIISDIHISNVQYSKYNIEILLM